MEVACWYIEKNHKCVHGKCYVTLLSVTKYLREVSYKEKGLPMEQNRRPEIKPHNYSHLIVDKGANTYTGEKTASSTNGAGKTGYIHAED
jgi:hypothetical protein